MQTITINAIGSGRVLHSIELSNNYSAKAALMRCAEDAVKQGVSLEWADLQNADLSGAKLGGGRFAHADLTQTNATGADLTGADFRAAKMRGAVLDKAKAVGAVFSAADMWASSMQDIDATAAEFIATKMRASTLRNGAFDRAKFDLAALQQCNVLGASFKGAELGRAQLGGTDLSVAGFGEAITVPGSYGQVLGATKMLYVRAGFVTAILLPSDAAQSLPANVERHFVPLALQISVGERFPVVAAA